MNPFCISLQIEIPIICLLTIYQKIFVDFIFGCDDFENQPPMWLIYNSISYNYI